MSHTHRIFVSIACCLAACAAHAQPAEWKLADVPTLREQGLDVLTPISYMVLAPKGITPAQAAWWDGVLTKTLQTDEIRKDIEKNLWTVDVAGHKELPAQLDAQFERYQKRLAEMGLVK